MANIQGRDLGAVAGDLRGILEEARSKLPKGAVIEMSGQAESMDETFLRMAYGLVGATLLVYLILVINFQSWTDPLIIVMALPGAFCGIVWMLIATGTTFNVPSLMGSIMTVGVATANSILLIAFANDELKSGKNAFDAAVAAGFARLRPVLMTAFAMIVGMVPMSLGLGEGGEQNAPLGRAVIGGLLLATVATLIFVPVVFAMLRRNWQPREQEEGAQLLASS
jgi:multidrug efflux pump subunit AcrB